MLLIKCMFQLLTNIFKAEEVASNTDRQHRDCDFIHLRGERSQDCGNHHVASSSSSACVTATYSMNRTMTEVPMQPIASSHQTHYAMQGTPEQCTAKEWAEALYSLMSHPVQADATKLPSALIGNGSSTSTSSPHYSAGLSAASSESEIESQESTDPERNEQQTLDHTNLNVSTGNVQSQEENVAMIGSNVTSSIQAHEIDTSLSVYRGSFSNIAVTTSPATALRSGPALSAIVSSPSSSGAVNSSIWLTTTERRFQSADRHLFQLLDVQERRLRSTDVVWGRNPTMGHESIRSEASNCTLNEFGICTSQSVVFGAEFYASHSGATPVLPTRQATRTVSNLEGDGQERESAIQSEIDRLFAN